MIPGKPESGWDRDINAAFPNPISSKVNVIERLEFELA